MVRDALTSLSLLIVVAGCGAAPPPCPVVPLAVLAPAPQPAATPPVDAVIHARGAAAEASDIGFAVRLRPFANLAYHLDCLSGGVHCSPEAIHALWDAGWTADDATRLAEWKAVHDRYQASFDLVGTEPKSARPPEVPLPHAGVDFDALLRLASLVSETPAEYRENLRVLLHPDAADRVARAAEHFWPRFQTFWTTRGGADGAGFKKGLEALFARGELPAILARAVKFYAAPIAPGTVIDLDLIVLPAPSTHTSAEQLVSHGVIEVVPGERPEDRMDVVCHELFHFFYNTRTPEQQLALLRRFASSNDPLAMLAYALLDESVATALGNGVVNREVNPPDYARRLARDKGFYNVHSIDATAKGLLSRTGDDPTRKSALDSDETVAAVIAATRDAVGADPPPLEYLRSFTRASEPGWWKTAMAATLARAHGNNTYDHERVDSADAVTMVTEHPLLPAVLLVSRAKLGALALYGDAIPKAARAGLARESKKPGAFAYAVRRSPQSWLFVLVADSAEDARAVADGFFAAPHVTAGVYRVPRVQPGPVAATAPARH